jgi:uncharacterized lipoprotein
VRKFLVLVLALTMAIGLAACSSKDDTKTANKEKKETETPKATDVKKPMVKFYMDLGNKINAVDADLNSYDAAVAKAAQDPTKKIEPEQKTKASESAAAVALALKNVQVPTELKNQKADLEAAIQDFAASYQAKADELKKDAPSFDAAEATFAQGEEKLGKVFESVKLLPPSLGKQVN